MKSFYQSFFLILPLFCCFQLLTPNLIFAKGVARHSLTEKEYVDLYFDLKKKGYRVKQVDGYAINGKLRFTAMWKKQSGAQLVTFHKMSAADFDAKAKSYMQKGFKMTWISGYKFKNQDFYAAIWVKKSGPRQVIRHRLSAQQYNDLYFKLKKQGYRLAKISGYSRAGKAQYAVIWEKRTGPQLATHHLMSSSDYSQKFQQYTRQGLWLSHLSAFSINNRDYYAAIWEKRPTRGISGRHRLSKSNYGIEFDNHYYSGFSLGMVSAYQLNGKAHFAAFWEADKIHGRDIAKINDKVSRFMKKYKLPGLQIAIGKDERLVFAKGYGHADLENNILMGPQHKARVASIAKVITAAGIMRLAEKRSDFHINQRIFGSGSVFGNDYANGDYTNNEKQIKVVHLLEHTAGGNKWDNNDYKDHKGTDFPESPKTNDPMGWDKNLSQNQLINTFLLSPNRESNLAPGRYYAYSNFGYLLLGKVIAKKSGQRYSTWIQNNILKPSGVKGMFISKTAKSVKRPNEVVYYETTSSNDPYGTYNIERMAAHGGWAASVIDLSKINVRIDGRSVKRDIISKNSYYSMMNQHSYASPQSVVNQSSTRCKGWEVWDSGSFMHNGTLPGTASRLKNRKDGFFYAIIANGRSDKDNFWTEFDKLGDEIIKLLNSWPSHDLM